jgi:hypothetical protein
VRAPRPLLRAAVRDSVRVRAPDPRFGPPVLRAVRGRERSHRVWGTGCSGRSRDASASGSRRPASGTRGVSLEPATRALPGGPSAPALRLHPQVSAGSPRGTRTLSTISGSRGPGLRTNRPEPEGSDLARPAPPEALPPVPKAWRMVRPATTVLLGGPGPGAKGRACTAASRNPPETDLRSREFPPLSVTGEPDRGGGSESDSSHLRRSRGFAPRLPATGGFHRRLPPGDPEASEDSFGLCRHCANPGSRARYDPSGPKATWLRTLRRSSPQAERTCGRTHRR